MSRCERISTKSHIQTYERLEGEMEGQIGKKKWSNQKIKKNEKTRPAKRSRMKCSAVGPQEVIV